MTGLFDYVVLCVAAVFAVTLYMHSKSIKVKVLFGLHVSFIAVAYKIQSGFASDPPAQVQNPVQNPIKGVKEVKKVEFQSIVDKVSDLEAENKKENRAAVERFRALPNKKE